MKALIKSTDSLALVEVETPRPGPGEVLVKIKCAGLCRTDLEVAAGRLESDSPRILGHECSGIVCRLGQGVEGSRLGEKVSVFPWLGCGSCSYCRNEQERQGYLCPQRRFLGWQLDGCFAQYLVVPERLCLTLDDEIDFQAGAYLEPVAAALGVTRAPLRKARNAAVIGGNRIADLTSLLLREYSQIDHQQIVVGEPIHNEYDLVVETGAGPTEIEFALNSLRPDGVLVLKSRPSQAVEWPVRLQVEKEITVMAFSYGSLLLAKRLLAKKTALFRGLWRDPLSLGAWRDEFERGWAGHEDKKVFFLPQQG